jgi:aspartyl-tRNA synthetase
LVWARRLEDGSVTSSIMKAMGEDAVRRLLEVASVGNGELLLIAAGEPDSTSRLLGQIRLTLARKDGLLRTDQYVFTWVVDFPLLDWDAEERRWTYVHHPFTSPHEDDLARLDSDPGAVRARAYDLVLNGSEIGGGSVRIHDSSLQRRIFSLLNISDEEARARFGFFLEALEYGTPPHGGIALGLDRVIALLSGESSIREVIAFPKTAAAADMMSDAPSGVDPRQLRELHIQITRP